MSGRCPGSAAALNLVSALSQESSLAKYLANEQTHKQWNGRANDPPRDIVANFHYVDCSGCDVIPRMKCQVLKTMVLRLQQMRPKMRPPRVSRRASKSLWPFLLRSRWEAPSPPPGGAGSLAFLFLMVTRCRLMSKYCSGSKKCHENALRGPSAR